VNESETVRRARGGDEAAWVALVQQHQAAAFRLAYLLLGDADEANDVAQEAFVRAFGAFHRFDERRPLRPWLLQIVRNLAANRRRSLRRSLAALQRWWQATPAREEDIEGEAVVNHTWQDLWQAVQQLPVHDQEVIYLRYFLDLSVAEAAATLGVAEGTVKSRSARAVQRLRTLVLQVYPHLGEEYLA
jgi:RNA polymerase sigma-70 factor (ECF subfamily)